MDVAEIMTGGPLCVSPDARLSEIRALLVQNQIHHLLVVERGKLAGVLSDRDVLRAMSPFVGQAAERTQDMETLARRAHQLMARRLVTARPSDDVRDAAARMLAAGVSCLPVVDDDGAPIGIVTWRDMLRSLLA